MLCVMQYNVFFCRFDREDKGRKDDRRDDHGDRGVDIEHGDGSRDRRDSDRDRPPFDSRHRTPREAWVQQQGQFGPRPPVDVRIYI